MLLEKRNYSREALLNKTVLLTGGGGGIGYEAARALSYMGAKVIIAEIDEERGRTAQDKINSEFGNGNVDFFQVNLADEKQIDALCDYIVNKYTRLDVIINNAAVVPMGAVDVVPVADWDLSYAVNLRAPVLLIQKFLPSMRENGGVIVFNPSGPGAFMSGYEIFKSAQVELCNTLDAELDGIGVITYGIAPGFVKTDTCIKAVGIVASSMGISADDFYASAESIAVDAETAGVGYAVSVANAARYRGQITSSQQVLLDADLLDEPLRDTVAQPSGDDNDNNNGNDRLLSLFTGIWEVFEEQFSNWMKKNLFVRQILLSDFKKQMGMPADAFKRQLESLYAEAQNGRWNTVVAGKDVFVKLQGLYAHQRDMLASFEKDPAQLKSDTAMMNGWIDSVREMIDELG